MASLSACVPVAVRQSSAHAAPRVAIASAPDRGSPFRSTQRLHNARDYSSVLASRTVLREGGFRLGFRETGTAKGARLGLIVPKRLAPTAVMRNAIKRQCREVFRRLAGGLPSGDVVLSLAKRVTTPPRAPEIRALWRKEIEILLERLKAAGG